MKLAVIFLLVSAVAVGSQSYTVDLNQTTVELVDEIAAQSAAEIAVRQRIANGREADLLGDIDSRDRRLRQEQHALRLTSKQVEQFRARLTQLNAERRKLLDQIAERSEAFAAQITSLKSQLAGLADQPDPALQSLLAEFASGQRRQSYPLIKKLIADANNRDNARLQHRIADRLKAQKALVETMFYAGEAPIEEYVSAMSAVAASDPADSENWSSLAYTYGSMGKRAEALNAAQHAVDTATTDRQKGWALIYLADTLSGHSMTGATSRTELTLAAADYQKASQLFTAATVTHWNQWDDVAKANERLGEVNLKLQNYEEAIDAFNADLTARDKQKAQFPGPDSVAAARYWEAVSQTQLGITYYASGDSIHALENLRAAYSYLTAYSPAHAFPDVSWQLAVNEFYYALAQEAGGAGARTAADQSPRALYDDAWRRTLKLSQNDPNNLLYAGQMHTFRDYLDRAGGPLQ